MFSCVVTHNISIQNCILHLALLYKDAFDLYFTEYVDTLMDRLLQKRYMNRSYSQAKKAKVLEPARPIPIAQSTPARPKKEDIVNSHRSRFNKM